MKTDMIPTDISLRVRGLRGRTGLTQEQFAQKLGVALPTINRWESGYMKPSPLAMKQIEALTRELDERGAGSSRGAIN